MHILVLGTADWNQAIATNQHYVVRELAKLPDARVTFVESLGLRRPQFTARDAKRVSRRVLTRFQRSTPSRQQRPVPLGAKIASPVTIPHHSGISATLNRRVVHGSVSDWLNYEGERVLWTYSPVTYGLEDVAHYTVYHCVDLLGTIPGIKPGLIASHEERLSKKNVRAIASSSQVAISLESAGFPRVDVWPNVADTDTFLPHAKPAAERDGTVTFAGNLAPNKVDFELLTSLAASGKRVQVAGPRAEGGGNDTREFDEMIRAGVSYVGLLDLAQLAKVLGSTSVGLIPYKINAYTRGVSPLKTYEYLAAGAAVVSTPIPSVVAGPDVTVVEGKAAFLRAVSSALHSSDGDIRRRLATANEHSWAQRGQTIREFLHSLRTGGDTSG